MEQAQHGARSLSTNGALTLLVKGSLLTIKASVQLQDELRITKRKLTSQCLKFLFKVPSTTVKETC
jgi:hypothetical protein